MKDKKGLDDKGRIKPADKQYELIKNSGKNGTKRD